MRWRWGGSEGREGGGKDSPVRRLRRLLMLDTRARALRLRGPGLDLLGPFMFRKGGRHATPPGFCCECVELAPK